MRRHSRFFVLLVLAGKMARGVAETESDMSVVSETDPTSMSEKKRLQDKILLPVVGP